MKFYAIENIIHSDLYYSKKYGYTYTGYDIFNEKEFINFPLPLTGKWIFFAESDNPNYPND